MNFSENWYTSSHWHKNNTGKVSWTSEVWLKKYEKVLNARQTNRQTTRSGPPHSHRRKLFVGDKKDVENRGYNILLYIGKIWCEIESSSSGNALMFRHAWSSPSHTSLVRSSPKKSRHPWLSSGLWVTTSVPSSGSEEIWNDSSWTPSQSKRHMSRLTSSTVKQAVYSLEQRSAV